LITCKAIRRANIQIIFKLADGNPLIPARWMAMTKGEAAAVPFFKLRDGLFEGTRSLV
jgi:hypothetical protein